MIELDSISILSEFDNKKKTFTLYFNSIEKILNNEISNSICYFKGFQLQICHISGISLVPIFKY